ncbi:Nif3-like dinuclear metal center hexameric protein [Aliidiomarina minuta]|uniref:GTP cyclohydrolase 1 type 2 homolog n=1 Tax=Aliidiomarina minuta TaxID=880057 RepID=A0A432W6L0_9GAMM|nr:Nif3-like dinuclear metal center hexameric protein [Aliidiomarina minuta]RUO25606.1 Nif3-like dinuclear metal center hexameric protein [Aliidiomarina minuta]
MQRSVLLRSLEQWLQARMIKDYCPNGLQVEGREEINKIVTGVTASQALIDAAIEVNADTLLVHHGYFWKGEDERVTGMKKRRLKQLLQQDMNLIAYHLPLDIQAEFGNNAELARLLQLEELQALSGLSPEGIVQQGVLPQALTGETFAEQLEGLLQRPLTASQLHSSLIKKVALCTGGGQGFIEAAVESGADAFVTGEVSEQTIHIARECGIHFFAAGHHATERYGVKALGDKIAAEYDVQVQFIDIDNPA